jgi:hypothetical protein
MRLKIRRNDDLPQPDGPMMAIIDRSLMLKVIFRSARNFP